MAKATISRTTPEDVIEFMGKLPPHRIYALTMREDGKIIGIGGFAYIGDSVAGFMEITPRVHRYPVTLHKTALRILEEAKARGYRSVTALADCNVSPAASRWLERLGFVPVETRNGTVHAWAG